MRACNGRKRHFIAAIPLVAQRLIDAFNVMDIVAQARK